METVKALVNLGEFSVQLEGPQAFVEKYLERYQSSLQRQQKRAPGRRKKIAAVTSTAKNTASKAEGMSCGKRILSLIDSGYFSEPRTSADILGCLREGNGSRHNLNQVCAVLSNLTRKGNLERSKEGRAYKYNNVKS